MVGWHHRLDEHESEQAPGVGDGQGSLACCGPWDIKELDMTEQVNNSNTVKGFDIVNETEADVFLEFPSYLYDPVNVGNLISGSSSFSKSSWDIWKFYHGVPIGFPDPKYCPFDLILQIIAQMDFLKLNLIK